MGSVLVVGGGLGGLKEKAPRDQVAEGGAAALVRG